MPNFDAAVHAYAAILDEELIYGPSPERDAALAEAHREVLIAQHANGACCAFCVVTETEAPRG